MNTKALNTATLLAAQPAPVHEPVDIDPLPRACNLAGVDYQTYLKIKAYMPVIPPAQPTPVQPVGWSDAKQAELNDWFLSLPEGRRAVLLEDKWMLAGAAFFAGKSITPPNVATPLAAQEKNSD